MLFNHPSLVFLSERIRKEVIRNLDINDPAHRQDHILAVVGFATEIATMQKLSLRDRRCLLAAAFMHDIGCNRDRDTHHLIGAILTARLLGGEDSPFDADDVVTVCQAVHEHRASYKEKRSGLISDLTRIADAGKLNPETFGDRAISYRFDRFNAVDAHERYEEIKEGIIRDAAEHLKDKYGKNGYMWESYPEIGMQMFAAEIDEMQLVSDHTSACQELLRRRWVTVMKAYVEEYSFAV